MPRYKKAPNGQWPGYPYLEINDIETLTIRQNKYVAESLVNNRQGHIVLLLEHEVYTNFLGTVRERKGDISERSVNVAVREAIDQWMKPKK